MKIFYPFLNAIPLLISGFFFLFATSNLNAQLSMTFENLTTFQNCGSTTCNYTDVSSPASAHVLMDEPLPNFLPVSSPSSAGILGFTSNFTPTRTGGSTTGLTDGDFFGYATSTVLSNNVGQNAFQGSQAFIAEDTDGQISIIFDGVDLTGVSSSMFSMNYILDGSFEFSDGANDLFYIGLDITGCALATTIDLLDANGTGAGGSTNMNDITDKTWFPLSQDLSIYNGCQVHLNVQIDLNSSTEELAIDNIVFTGGMPVMLPVELLNFTAAPRVTSVDLLWSTATELNNDKFIVEASQDGRQFQKIGEQKGKGTSEQQQAYSFEVKNPKPGITYYRLKQLDYDGTFAYSKVVSVNYTRDLNTVGHFFPNPTHSGIVNLNYNSDRNEELLVSVFNMTGKLVSISTKQILNGKNQLSFDFSTLTPGMYMVLVKDGKTTLQRKLIISQ